MIISALATHLKDQSQKALHEIVKYYPHITFVDEDGVKKSEVMNKYFLVSGQPNIFEDIRFVDCWFLSR